MFFVGVFQYVPGPYTALLLTSPMIGKASRRLHFICVLLEEQTSCQPNLRKYKYALSARFPYFNQRHTLRSWVKYNWRPIAFGLTLNGKIFNFYHKNMVCLRKPGRNIASTLQELPLVLHVLGPHIGASLLTPSILHRPGR